MRLLGMAGVGGGEQISGSVVLSSLVQLWISKLIERMTTGNPQEAWMWVGEGGGGLEWLEKEQNFHFTADWEL